jgi:predicted peroxiredoxin
MSQQIKLIWDFRGPSAAKTAEHHEIHLKEYIKIEKLPITKTGVEIYSDSQSIAFMIVPESLMIQVRDALKPHRGELHEE